MKIIQHPVAILAFATLPFLSYSLQRTGYEVGHLFAWRLVVSHYAIEGLLLAGVTAFCSIRYDVTEDFTYTLISCAAVIAYLGAQVFEKYPADYKLWTYVVPQIMLWTVVGTATALVFSSKRRAA